MPNTPKNTDQKSDSDQIRDITKHPAYQDDWNNDIEKQMMKAPDGCYAVIKNCGKFMAIHTNDHKLYGEFFREVPGLGVVGNEQDHDPDNYSYSLTTYNKKDIWGLLEDDKINFQLPFNQYRKDPEKFRFFTPLKKYEPKISSPDTNRDEMWLNFISNLVHKLKDTKNDTSFEFHSSLKCFQQGKDDGGERFEDLTFLLHKLNEFIPNLYDGYWNPIISWVPVPENAVKILRANMGIFEKQLADAANKVDAKTVVVVKK